MNVSPHSTLSVALLALSGPVLAQETATADKLDELSGLGYIGDAQETARVAEDELRSIRFEDPPPASPGKYTGWADIVSALRLRPGDWAFVATKETPTAAWSTANNIRRGAIRGMPRGEFEAVARVVGGEHRVYARYVGGAA